MGSPRGKRRKKDPSGGPTSILRLYPLEKLTERVSTKVTPSIAKYLRKRNTSKWIREAIIMRLRKET